MKVTENLLMFLAAVNAHAGIVCNQIFCFLFASLLCMFRWTKRHRGGADDRLGAGGLVHQIAPGIGNLGLPGHLDRRQ